MERRGGGGGRASALERKETRLAVARAWERKKGMGANILYIHLLTCMARCQKYCQASMKTTAIQNWNPGITSQ